MIIINADDWGNTRKETDAALSCYKNGRITSVSAMVFMEDSGRAAEIGKDAGVDIGLHLNLTRKFTGEINVKLINDYQGQIIRYLNFNRYSFLFYNPILRNQFRYVYQAQVEEFNRLYARPPTHIDGHHHKHLCTNILLDRIIPEYQRVRRSFSFLPGEKGFANRLYRRLIDKWLELNYQMTDYFFSLSEALQKNRMNRVIELAKNANVELETHPVNLNEYAFLMSDEYLLMFDKLEKGNFSFL